LHERSSARHEDAVFVARCDSRAREEAVDARRHARDLLRDPAVELRARDVVLDVHRRLAKHESRRLPRRELDLRPLDGARGAGVRRRRVGRAYIRGSTRASTAREERVG
jgi:hypothetical protein